IRALGAIDQVAPCGIGLGAVGLVAERDEQAARITRHPVHGKRARAVRERDRDPADPAERERLAAVALGQAKCRGPGSGWGSGLDGDLEPETRVVLEMRRLKRRASVGWDG